LAIVQQLTKLRHRDTKADQYFWLDPPILRIRGRKSYQTNSRSPANISKFDEATFAIKDSDPDTYRQFTARKTPSLHTWASIGGGSFGSEPWEKMTSSDSGRAAFISSLRAFTTKYGFEGVNLGKTNFVHRCHVESTLSRLF
jgi:hypothetical protein